MTKEEKLHILIPRMMEHLAKQIGDLPSKGPFEPNFVVIDYPDTNYEGFLRYEIDRTDGSGKGRRLRTSMCPVGSNMAISHYIFKGTKGECLAWLRDKETEAILTADYTELKESLDKRD